MNFFKKLTTSATALVIGAFASVSAHAAGATDPVSQIFASIDLTTVGASVIALGVLVIGVNMAFKGVDLGKRGVRKV